jgi:hypothetical protein
LLTFMMDLSGIAAKRHSRGGLALREQCKRADGATPIVIFSGKAAFPRSNFSAQLL